jgi:hypothetical protein
MPWHYEVFSGCEGLSFRCDLTRCLISARTDKQPMSQKRTAMSGVGPSAKCPLARCRVRNRGKSGRNVLSVSVVSQPSMPGQCGCR